MKTRLLLGLASSIIGWLYSGFVLSVLWGWFVVPVFHLPALTIPVAIGLGLIVGLLTQKIPTDEELKASSIINVFLYPLINGTILLVAGYVAHMFV